MFTITVRSRFDAPKDRDIVIWDVAVKGMHLHLLSFEFPFIDLETFENLIKGDINVNETDNEGYTITTAQGHLVLQFRPDYEAYEDAVYSFPLQDCKEALKKTKEIFEPIWKKLIGEEGEEASSKEDECDSDELEDPSLEKIRLLDLTRLNRREYEAKYYHGGLEAMNARVPGTLERLDTFDAIRTELRNGSKLMYQYGETFGHDIDWSPITNHDKIGLSDSLDYEDVHNKGRNVLYIHSGDDSAI